MGKGEAIVGGMAAEFVDILAAACQRWDIVGKEHPVFERWGYYYKIRMVFAVIILFFVSLAMSCQELRYMVSGKTADAFLVSDQIVVRSTRNSEHEQRVIRYTFSDNGKQRQEFSDVDMDWPRVEGATVKVQYIAGLEDQSRLLGQHHTAWVTVFLGSLVAGGIGVWALSREK